MENLDTIAKEVSFAMTHGGKKSERENLDRVFQFGNYKGRSASFTKLYAGNEDTYSRKPKLETESEFDALVARYDADPRWTRRTAA